MSLLQKSQPLHGGDIISASERYGIALDQWVDLSTGINPDPYPIDDILASAFYQLPYLQPAFINASSQYYKNDQFIATAGTQSVIQWLPKLLKQRPVLIPQIGYREHCKHWQHSGAPINYYPSIDYHGAVEAISSALAINHHQHIVVINPNNPTGIRFEVSQLLHWAMQLAAGAYLIIDEAFIDVTPQHSVLTQTLPNNIIVLRSFGKFFGLAGVRLGYVFANQTLLNALQNTFGLWSINGPAQSIAVNTLRDGDWQQQAREAIRCNGLLTQSVFATLFNKPSASGHLFFSYSMPYCQARYLCEYFAEAGILLRLIPLDHQQAIIRVGLLSQQQPLLVARIKKRIAAYLKHKRFNKEQVL